MNKINESRLSSFLYSIALNTSKEGAKQRTEKVFITLAEHVERHVTTYPGGTSGLLDFIGLHRTSLDFVGLHWTSSDFIGLHRTSLDFILLRRTSTDFDGLQQTSMDFIGLPTTSFRSYSSSVALLSV